MSVVNITHYDLDGVGSAICLKRVYKDTTVYPTGYNNLLQTIIDAEQAVMSANLLYITDLQLDEDCIRILDEYIKKYNVEVHIYDHHKNIRDIINQINPSIIYKHSLKFSGTGIVYKQFRNYLDNNDKHNALYNEFFRCINSFDLWDVENEYFKQGIKYNDLFWEYKFHKFIAIYSDLENLQVLTESRDVSRIQENKLKYFNFLQNNHQLLRNETWCISYADKYINELQVYYPGHKYYINVTSKGNLSLRVDNKHYNIIPVFQEFLKEYKPLRGGGHEFIYSTQMSQSTSEILDIIKKFVNHKYE